MKSPTHLAVWLIISTMVGLNQLPAQITTYPYTMSFEASETIDWGPLATGFDCTADWYNSDQSNVSNSGAENAQDGSIFLTAHFEGCTPQEKIIIGPSFDFTGLNNPVFSFYYHMYGAEMGTLDLEISDDNGTSWTPVMPQLSGQLHPSKTAPWSLYIADLVAYAGQTVLLQFKGFGLGDNSSFCLDNFRVYNAANNQADAFYSYDEAGNRTSRQYFVSLVEDEELIAAVRSELKEDESALVIDPSLVNIYPNPASDFINVELNQKASVSKVYLFDITGRQIDEFSMSGNFTQVDMSSYDKGSYILFIQAGGHEIARKVMKQ